MANAPSAPKLCTTCGARYPADALFCPSDGAPLTSAGTPQAQRTSDPAHDAYVGRELAGHIEVRQLAGVGAMGRVYRAFQKGIDRDVAVKILHRELSANPQLVQRFHREAKVASRLLHPNVVQVHLAGQLPDGALYIVMEYLDGLSLQSALAAAGGSLPLARALHVALQICDAVGEAHAQGIVHRDLKPENVMLVHRGEDADFVKVLDFGIARLDWGEQSMATAAGLIFGTARYISPEGAQGEQVGPEGDVYALATLTYQMLAGRTPFEGEQAVGLLVQQIHDAPPPLKSIPRASYVPEPVAQVVMANLAKERTGRAPDARALGRLLLEAARAGGLSAEDLVPRSILLGARASSLQLASMQRTRQLQLDRPITEMSAAPAELPRTAYEAPADTQATASQLPPTGAATHVMGRVSIPSAPSAASVGSQGPAPAHGATQKWSPPAAVAAQMNVPTPPPSNVDITLDDSSGTPPPLFPVSGRDGRTHVPATASAPPTLESAAHPGARARGPSASFDGDEDDGGDELEPRAARWRRVGVVLLCFLLGIGLTSAVAYRMHFVGPPAQASVDDAVARAEDALRRKHFDAPPGDNVRDLTSDGLAKWPGEPRLLALRSRTTDELVKDAVGRQLAGDTKEALHLAQLARELDPEDSTARKLAEEYDLIARGKAASGPLVVVPLLDAGSAPLTGRAPTTAIGPFRTTMDVSPARPRVGQAVDLVVRVATASGGAPRKPIEEPHFTISGSAIGGDGAAQLPAFADASGLFRASFTFLAAGKYDVTFHARSDGIAIKTLRSLVTTEAPAPPPTPPDTPEPAPSGSGVKWL